MRKPSSGAGHGDKLVDAKQMTESRDKTSQSTHIQVHIGDKLKALYAEVVNQPVPDHLLDLVSKLEARSKSR